MKLKLVVFIVDLQITNIVTNVLSKAKVRFHWTNIGQGTASSETLDLLGIEISEKAIILCVEQQAGVPVLLREVQKKLRKKGPGAGIGFTIPLSAINDPLLLFYKESISKNENTGNNGGEFVSASPNRSINDAASAANKGDYMKPTHDLILCVVNHGNSDAVMKTARAAGATGGTVMNARGTAHEGPVKFFGISVQDEKEVILILTKQDKKTEIMQAICEEHGLNKEAQGIVFSLPVDSVMGLSIE